MRKGVDEVRCRGGCKGGCGVWCGVKGGESSTYDINRGFGWDIRE